MFEALLAVLAGDTRLGEDQIALIKSLFIPRAVARGRFFQRAGEVTSRGGFVVRGCFRTYAIDAQGKERIVRFSPEGAWIGDIQSATSGTPTLFFVQALEPSDLLTIDLPSFEKLLKAIPEAERRYRLGLQRGSAARDRRIVMGLQSSAEERYLDFLESYPSLAQRVPQHMLASYLGMTPETLSRIRRKLRER